MKSALITGVTGQDGSYLAELLIEKVKINNSESEYPLIHCKNYIVN
tara:strand:+ start:188 stop:325 length:138 start_codon:yes stop_codon:yes gene_type:complete